MVKSYKRTSYRKKKKSYSRKVKNSRKRSTKKKSSTKKRSAKKSRRRSTKKRSYVRYYYPKQNVFGSLVPKFLKDKLAIPTIFKDEFYVNQSESKVRLEYNGKEYYLPKINYGRELSDMKNLGYVYKTYIGERIEQYPKQLMA